MSCAGTSDCLCGCCAGTSVETPQPAVNRPGLSSIAYRVGSWATFRESMLARLSSSDYPALAALKTRDNDDFTIAFLDATSMMLDILTFYQERLANESYLRTATELRSLTELSRLIGYQPAPEFRRRCIWPSRCSRRRGRRRIQRRPPSRSRPARRYKAFRRKTRSRRRSRPPVLFLRRPIGTRLPRNPPSRGFRPGRSACISAGTSTQLQTGDALLILGVEREQWTPALKTPSEQWDLVVLNKVETDTARGLTYVAWDKRISHVTGDGTSGSPSSWTSARVYALRQKAALFGHNAPNPNLFVNANNPAATSSPGAYRCR